jgi:nitrate reductase NapE component
MAWTSFWLAIRYCFVAPSIGIAGHVEADLALHFYRSLDQVLDVGAGYLGTMYILMHKIDISGAPVDSTWQRIDNIVYILLVVQFWPILASACSGSTVTSKPFPFSS